MLLHHPSWAIRKALQTKMSNALENKCQTWMAQAQQGDKTAYTKLLEQVELLATRYLATRLSVKSDADDIVQEMLISVHKARASFEPTKPFFPWMYTIFKYRLQDYLRRHYRTREREAAEPDWPQEDENAPNPETDAEYKELSEALLTTLRPKPRHIVELLYLEGHSAQEVSEKLEISVADVRTTAHRAMKQLKLKAEEVG